MKNKTILCVALALVLSFAITFPTYALEPDGSISGKVIDTIDGKDIIEYPVSKDIQKIQKLKEAKASLFFNYKDGKINKKEYTSKLKDLGINQNEINNELNLASPLAITSGSQYLGLVQRSQDTYYYCGPATAQEILKYKTSTLYSQSTLATPLRCNTSGTPWYDGLGTTGYPMADTLNSYIGSTYYIPYGTSVNSATFLSNVTWDIVHFYPVAGDAWEVPGGPHLVGHPTGSTIYHWFAIYGINTDTNYIRYADSVAGCSQISWSGNVPTYSDMYYTTLATIVNGRGIIW
ncbi:C39 family peptidase [Dehalobacter restrictus]|uniref:Peptidase C39-like domain-containing protein n=1 Tax=Dehalobacter restrictus TaxID=55583 RepID=A0A857DLC3_9FIRM|nr:C39 family peptidase [Dehalobacter restrictus]QHA01185.1 hypothetical protein GQ588_11325 [Dehalobacter restrictus]